MAIILRGRHKNKKVKLRQWCNDWMTVDKYPDEIFSPTNFQFEWEEMEDILKHPCGFLLDLFKPTEDLKLIKRTYENNITPASRESRESKKLVADKKRS